MMIDQDLTELSAEQLDTLARSLRHSVSSLEELLPLLPKASAMRSALQEERAVPQHPAPHRSDQHPATPAHMKARIVKIWNPGWVTYELEKEFPLHDIHVKHSDRDYLEASTLEAVLLHYAKRLLDYFVSRAAAHEQPTAVFATALERGEALTFYLFNPENDPEKAVRMLAYHLDDLSPLADPEHLPEPLLEAFAELQEVSAALMRFLAGDRTLHTATA